MVKSTKQMLGAAIAVPVFGMVMIGSAAAAPETCNWKTARNLANAGDYAGLCDCVQVTPSFLDRLQKRSDFATTLSVTGAQCPGLAALLTDLPTASLSVPAENRGESRGSEPGGPGLADAGGAASGGGASGSSGGETGGGGGESGGGDSESDGGESESGGGEGKGGKGKGEGKGGKGKGEGKGGKGGGKGNNGHGNGGEGSSPGRGNNANDDENGDRPGRGGGKERR